MYYMKDLEQLTWQGGRVNWNEERLGEVSTRKKLLQWFRHILFRVLVGMWKH